jgi:hypothetical protein
MLQSRRSLFQSFAGVTTALAASPLLFSQARPAPQPLPSPNAPNPNYPQGMNGPGPTPVDKKAINQENQKQIREDIDRMYVLISDLKQEISVTNTGSVLDVSFVKKAQQIEKLAKQVKELSKS